MKARLITTVAIMIAAAAVGSTSAAAHPTSGVPSHTRPVAAGLQPFTSPGFCSYGFYNPTVLGYTDEYVYWRLWIAFPKDGVWKYEFGEWRRARVTANSMTFGWESQQWPDYAWRFANGPQSIIGPGSTNTWLGWEIYYSSKNTYHFEWLGNVNVRC